MPEHHHPSNPPSLGFAEPILIPARDNNVLDLIDVVAAIIDARSGSSVLAGLAAAAPLRSLSHAKRVRRCSDDPAKLEVLVCALNSSELEEEDDLDGGKSANGELFSEAGEASLWTPPPKDTSNIPTLESLPSPIAAALGTACELLFIARVPRYAPHSKEDQKEWGMHWPVSLRAPDKTLLKERIALPDHEVSIMHKHMNTAWDIAVQNGAVGCVSNACVIVDPGRDIVVGTGVDRSHAHPLHHAVMIAVESVAAWQRKTWPGKGLIEPSSSAVELAGTENGVEKKENLDKKDRKEEGDREGEKESAKRQRIRIEESNTLQSADVRERPLAVVSFLENVEDTGGAAVEHPGDRPYLCTGYDAYVVCEPCAMCAMALVHSRLRRVVYCQSDVGGGVFGGSGMKLHSKRSLNHHYAVYRMPRSDD